MLVGPVTGGQCVGPQFFDLNCEGEPEFEWVILPAGVAEPQITQQPNGQWMVMILEPGNYRVEVTCCGGS